MTLFACDLDNTLIYSYKHDIGKDKINVELYQAKEISFITKKTHSLLQEVASRILFVPVTTRSIEQYKRISFPDISLDYALVCNGGVLLVKGKKDEFWYRESLRLIRPSLEELNKGLSILESDTARLLDVRFIENLFVFTKSAKPETTLAFLKKSLDANLVEVFNNGEKVYILPKGLSKGNAIKRFKNFIKADTVLAAGDSEFDVSMFENCDLALVPKDFKWKINSLSTKIEKNDSDLIFSEFILQKGKVYE